MSGSTGSSDRNAATAILLCGALFLSGAGALLFETLWFRATLLAFGSSVAASSLVLASFMAGLALGNALAARVKMRLRRPLATYAGLEVAIATSGVALVLLLPLLGAWLAPIFRPFVDQPWLIHPLRFGIAFLILLVPSTAMGLTLPVVVSALTAWDRGFGSVLGRLYGWNTLGAVAGALAAEWALIAALGIRGTAVVAAGCNLAAAAVVLLLARRAPASVGAIERGAEAETGQADPTRRARWCCLAAFLSGGILLGCEVVWFRFLHLFVHGGSVAFASMLATVLAAIGLGGLAAALWLRFDRAADRHAPTVALVAGSVSVAVYLLFRFALAPHGDAYVFGRIDVLVLAACLTVPTSFASGLLFTLTGVALQRAVPQEVRAAGLLTLCNTTGAAAGSLVAGFVLLPLIGMERAFFLLALGYAFVSVALLLGTQGADGSAPPWRRAPWLSGIPFLALLVFFPFGLMQERYLEAPIRRATQGKPAEVVAFREGRTQTLTYIRYDFFGEPLGYQLVTDGYNMAGSGFTARRYMKMFVYLPVALAPEPRNALLISYGTGSTAKALTDTPSLERIDVVDTSNEVIQMSDIVFSDPAEHPLRDPRVRVHIEDGRFFLQTTDRRYDLITGEPPPPKMAGVVNLYTTEFFGLIHDRLADGGMTSYWLAAQNLTEADAQAIVRAFCDVFDDCSLWQGFRLNWILLGSRGATYDRNERSFRRQWENPRSAKELSALGFELPEQLGATFIAGPRQLDEMTRGVAPLTDNRPKRLSDPDPGVARGIDVLEPWMDTRRTSARFLGSEFVRRAWPGSLRDRTRGYFRFQQRINEIYRFPRRPADPYRSMEELHDTLTRSTLRTLVLWQLGLGSDEAFVFRRLIEAGRTEPVFLAPRGMGLLAQRDYEQAAQAFGGSWQATRDPRSLRMLLYALCMSGRVEQARQFLRRQPASAVAGRADSGYWRWMEERFGLAPAD